MTSSPSSTARRSNASVPPDDPSIWGVITLKYILALIVTAALIATLSESVVASEPQHIHIVYVDKSELARLHPGWQALDDMRSVLNGAGSSEIKPAANKTIAAPTSVAVQKQKLTVVPSRSELVAKAASDASAALDQLETRKYAALQARRESMKAHLLKSAESEWKSKERDINRAAAAQTKAVDDRYAADLVNVRLRQTASKAASEISRKDDAGMDKDVVDEQVSAANAEAARIKAKADAEKKLILSNADAEIEAAKKASDSRVEELVRIYETEQGQNIAISIASARSDIAGQLGPASAPGLFAECNAGSRQSLTSLSGCRVDRMLDLKAAASALQSRIEADVSELVLELASQKGLNVTFEKNKDNPLDETQMFADLIKKHGWNTASPSMGRLGRI